jgi:hypothetical protein
MRNGFATLLALPPACLVTRGDTSSLSILTFRQVLQAVQTEKRVTPDILLHAIPLCSSVGEVAAASRRFHQGTVGVGFLVTARLNEATA